MMLAVLAGNVRTNLVITFTYNVASGTVATQSILNTLTTTIRY